MINVAGIRRSNLLRPPRFQFTDRTPVSLLPFGFTVYCRRWWFSSNSNYRLWWTCGHIWVAKVVGALCTWLQSNCEVVNPARQVPFVWHAWLNTDRDALNRAPTWAAERQHSPLIDCNVSSTTPQHKVVGSTARGYGKFLMAFRNRQPHLYDYLCAPWTGSDFNAVQLVHQLLDEGTPVKYNLLGFPDSIWQSTASKTNTQVKIPWYRKQYNKLDRATAN